MNKNSKFSLTLINSASLIMFLILMLIGISIATYYSTQKVIDYNVSEYFKQTNNLTSIILDFEKSSLNKTAYEISKLLQKIDKENVNKKIEAITSIDQIDLLYVKSNNEIKDYSNSLFDTTAIIKHINEIKISLDNVIINIPIDNVNHLLLLSSKKIVDDETGRVLASLYAGKIINDNFSLTNSIKKKAFLEDVYIYFNKELIATSANKHDFNIEEFKEEHILSKNDFLYFKVDKELYQNQKFNIVFVAKNSTFELLKDEFKEIGSILLIFVLGMLFALYFVSNRFIIKPFSALLHFARTAKDNKNVKYLETHVLEFDNFAVSLKSIIDEVRDLKEQYSRAIDGVQDGLWDYDLKTRKTYSSKRFFEMLGYENDLSIDNLDFWKKSIHKDDYIKIIKKIIEHKNGKYPFFEENYRFLCKDGSYKWIKIRGKIFTDENNDPVHITGFHTDIDDIVKLQKNNERQEQMLYQQAKLASMGEMIGNIAHQWRQPLSVISTVASGQILKIELKETNEKDAHENLTLIMDTVQYLSKIIDKFRYFFNPNKQLEEFYIDDLINDNMEIFESSYRLKNIELIMDLTHIEIKAFKFELVQVIVNIINNASDALVDKYSLSEKKYVFLDSFEIDGNLVLKIYDNAGGIKDEIKDKIYEPYFTTKHQSQGTGLGLYMSNEIIKNQLKGTLENETISYDYKGNNFEGELFTISLPLK